MAIDEPAVATEQAQSVPTTTVPPTWDCAIVTDIEGVSYNYCIPHPLILPGTPLPPGWEDFPGDLIPGTACIAWPDGSYSLFINGQSCGPSVTTTTTAIYPPTAPSTTVPTTVASTLPLPPPTELPATGNEAGIVLFIGVIAVAIGVAFKRVATR